jgi:hypothetical protein
VRFGVAEAHGKGSGLQLRRCVEVGAATVDASSGRYTVNKTKLRASIEKLVHDICMVQHSGDKTAADAMLATYGAIDDGIAKAIAKLDGVPVDLRPIYPVAGE